MFTSLKSSLFAAAIASCAFASANPAPPSTPPQRPNVIIILADDLGYGDLGCYGSSQLKTPSLDSLASQGLRFTNGYATSATCTPSRYSLLTGTYAWRKKVDIAPGDAPLLIPTDKPSLASIFRDAGYKTAAIGKWHLGLGKGDTDWNKPISPGTSDIGFDHSFLMAATNDRVPCVYFSNGKIVGIDPADPIEVNYRKNFPGLPTGKANPELLKMLPSHGHADSIVNGVSRIGFMKGGQNARWIDEDMASIFSREAIRFIQSTQNHPFFLYYCLHQPHVPRLPNPKFAGKSGLGPRGDVILEADAQIGELLDFLKSAKLADNTLIVFSSDNGPVLDDGYHDQAPELARKLGYLPAGPLRGAKYSLFEAGTRVPFIVSWPGTINPGVSATPVSQLDLMASLARLCNLKTPQVSDSLDTLDVFLGKPAAKGRQNFIIEATGRLAYREGDWVFIPPYPGPKISAPTGSELGNSPQPALFNIANDPHQDNNLAPEMPEKLEAMRKAFTRAKN